MCIYICICKEKTHFTGKIRYLLAVFSLSVSAGKKNRETPVFTTRVLTVKTWIGSVFKLKWTISLASGSGTYMLDYGAWVLSILKFDPETGSDSVLPRYLFCSLLDWFCSDTVVPGAQFGRCCWFYLYMYLSYIYVSVQLVWQYL